MILVSQPPSATSPWTLVMKVHKWSLTSSPLLVLILIKLMLGLPVMPMTPLLMMMTLISNQTSQSSLGEDQLNDSDSEADVKTCIMLQRTLVWILLSEWGGT